MKLTLKQLRNLVLKEVGEYERFERNVRVSDEIYEADPSDMLEFANAYVKLGNSVQEQLDDLLNGDYESVNPNAIKLIEEKLSGYNRILDDAVDEYNERYDSDETD